MWEVGIEFEPQRHFKSTAATGLITASETIRRQAEVENLAAHLNSVNSAKEQVSLLAKDGILGPSHDRRTPLYTWIQGPLGPLIQ